MSNIVRFCLLLCVSTVVTAQPVLHLYHLRGALPDSMVHRFELTCDCRVVQGYFGDNDDLGAKLTSSAADADVVFSPSFSVPALLRRKLLQPINRELVPHLSNLRPILNNPAYDPGNQHSVPITLSLTAVGYNIAKLRQLEVDPYSWSVIFDPRVLSKLRGHVMVLDRSRSVFAAALMYLGLDPNSSNEADYQRARDLIAGARPYWVTSTNERCAKGLASGDIWVALGNSTDFFQAREAAQREHRPFTIGYVLQREGNQLSISGMTVPAAAPHPDLAMRFINFMLSSKNAAEMSNQIGATNPVASALPYFREELKFHPVINPDNSALRKWVVLREMNPKLQRLINQMWNELRPNTIVRSRSGR
jgi:spermidine/putrescine-binding protein